MEFFETIYSQKLIAGNCFIQAVFANNEKFYKPKELYILRPDRINIIAGKNLYPLSYRYKIDNKETDFPVNQLNGQSEILHIKNYNPTNDWYGLSQVEPAAYSIDQHNEASKWNQSILQNGAKPCGALIVKNEGENNNLTDEQFLRLKEQLNEEFSGSNNAGKPLLLEGGLDWKEISLSPKEMDFLEMKHSTARDIALSFGVLLNIFI
jgi:HK97 family phage portal protein